MYVIYKIIKSIPITIYIFVCISECDYLLLCATSTILILYILDCE